MLDQLPDVVLINFFRHLPYDQRLTVEQISHRFNELMQQVWNKKETLVFPFDIWELNRRYPVSSCLDRFGKEMSVLIEHCPNLNHIRFENYKRLQIVMQSTCMTHFERYPWLSTNIREIFIGGLYVTDLDTIREMGRLFPNLEKLSILRPYPLVHNLRPDTLKVLGGRIQNLEPQVWALMDDNQRVTEDIRLYLELFPKLRTLVMKEAVFDVIEG